MQGSQGTSQTQGVCHFVPELFSPERTCPSDVLQTESDLAPPLSNISSMT